MSVCLHIWYVFPIESVRVCVCVCRCLQCPLKWEHAATKVAWSRWAESVRKDVECAFGRLKGRFRCLKLPCRFKSQVPSLLKLVPSPPMLVPSLPKRVPSLPKLVPSLPKRVPFLSTRVPFLPTLVPPLPKPVPSLNSPPFNLFSRR